MLEKEENPDFSEEFTYNGEKRAQIVRKKPKARIVLIAAAAVLLLLVAVFGVVWATRQAGVYDNNEHGGPANHGDWQIGGNPQTPGETAAQNDVTKEFAGTSDVPTAAESETPTESEAPTESETTGGDAPDETQTPGGDMPEWYTPGTLLVRTVTRSAPASTAPDDPNAGSINTNVKSVEFSSSVGSRYLNVTELLEASEHNEHGYVLYDVKKNDLICFQCIAKEMLGNRELKENEYISLDRITDPDFFSFIIYNSETNVIVGRWICDRTKGVLYEAPTIGFDFIISPDRKHASVNSARVNDTDFASDCEDVYLCSVGSMTAKNVSGDHPTNSESTFSPDGLNLLSPMKNERGQTYTFDNSGAEKCIFLLTNVETLAQCTGVGLPLSYADGLLITRATDGYHVYDRKECKEIAFKEPIYIWETRDGKLLKVNILTGEETEFGDEPRGWRISQNGKYAYGYTAGDECLVCCSLDSGELFKIRLNDEFVNEIKRLLRENYMVTCQIQINDKMDEVLICYYTTKKHEPSEDEKESEAYWERMERFYELFPDAFRNSTSIKEFLELFEKADPDDVFEWQALRGDGYTCLCLENWVFIEDYNHKIFTAFNDRNNHVNIMPYPPASPLYFTCDSEPEKTERFLEERGIPIKDDDFDYGFLLTDHGIDGDAANAFFLSDAYLDAYEGEYYSYLFTDFGYSSDNLDMLRTFIRELNDCKEKKTVNGTPAGKPYTRVKLGENELALYVSDSGKYYLTAGRMTFEVPEYIFADMIALNAFTTFCFNLRMTPSSGPASAFVPGSENSEAPILTTERLRAFLADGRKTEDLAGYMCDLFTVNPNYIGIVFPCADGNALCGYLIVRLSPEGTLKELLLLDTSLRLCADLTKEDLPEGRLPESKGQIDYPAYVPYYLFGRLKLPEDVYMPEDVE